MARLASISTVLFTAMGFLSTVHATPIDAGAEINLAPRASVEAGSSSLSNIVAVINGYTDKTGKQTLNEVILLSMDECKPITSNTLDYTWKSNRDIILRAYKRSSSGSCLCNTPEPKTLLGITCFDQDVEDYWCVKAI